MSLEFNLNQTAPASATVDCVVVGAYSDGSLTPAATALDTASSGKLKALVTEPTVYRYAERHDNIEAIYKKLTERRDTADVTELLKALHRIVNEAISTKAPGQDQAGGVTFDLSRIDMDKLRQEFANAGFAQTVFMAAARSAMGVGKRNHVIHMGFAQ